MNGLDEWITTDTTDIGTREENDTPRQKCLVCGAKVLWLGINSECVKCFFAEAQERAEFQNYIHNKHEAK